VPGGEAFMCLRRISKCIDSRDRDLKVRRLDGATQTIELADAGNRIVRDDMNPAPLLWLRVYSVWIGDPPTGSDRIEAPLQTVATSQRKHGIDAVGCELTCGGRDIFTASVHGDIRAETAGELQAVFTRRGREHSCGA
jgi:hypothetical protein